MALRNLGCRLNRVELDRIGEELVAAGCVVVGEREADVIVVNSCAVTGEAEAKCRKAVRHAAALPGGPLVIVTGCMATLFADETSELGERVIVVREKRDVAAAVLGASARDDARVAGPGASARDDARVAGPGASARDDARDVAARAVTVTGRTRPGVKIQDGCDNRCSFCIVWRARGASRSVAVDDVVAQVRVELGRGAREVVLSGINLGSYRAERAGHTYRLPELLETLLAETEVGRLRLSSVEPPDADVRLAEVMAASEGRVAPFLHLCLQAGCNRTLRRMGRVYDTALFRERVRTVRELVPDLALGTDLIVGFPGETEGDFEDSYAFCREMGFAKMHVFRYSRRPGTPAASMEGQVDPLVMAERSERMRNLAERMRREFAAGRVGKRERVLVQALGRGVTGGLLDVLVDEALPTGELVDVVPQAVAGDVLVAR